MRLGKPDMLMEDARKLKHTGDRTVSPVAQVSNNVEVICTHIAELRGGEGTALLRRCSHLHDLLCEQRGKINSI